MIDTATIPEDLQGLSQWVVWRFENRQGKKTKVPYDARTGRCASTKNASTWASLEVAASSASDGRFDGIGFVFSESDPFCGIDLDDCIGEDHKIGPWAQKIIERFNTYTEVSPSGRGVKLFLRGRIPPGGNRKGKIELYDRGRYFTVTTRHLEGTPHAVEDRQAELEAFHRELFIRREVGRSRRDAPPSVIEDEELLRKARAAKNGEKFAALFDRGDTSAYGRDDSSADLALCSLLAFWCGRDPARIDRLFRRSVLMRRKWDSRRGEKTYGEITVAKALRGASESYGNRASEIPYEATDRGLVHFKETRDGVVSVLLTNFTARIVGEVVHDDGVEITRSFEIEATLRGRVLRFEVSASKFPGLGWVTENLGPNAVVFAGYSAKDHTRAAIQLLSGDAGSRTVYAHLGWREVGDQWVYLHGDGAIGPTGTVPGIEIDALGQLSRYVLPPPPAGKDLAGAVRGSLAMLDLLPDEIVLPVYCAIWRATVGCCDFSLHLAGQTGEGKSELAALVQQHFGAEMDSRHLPGSWSSTGNALEAVAFAAKDAVLVVDDFAPEGTASDVQRQHREAARVLRAQGNRSGRGRLRRDATLRPDKPPRGLIISTGEDVPKGQSIRARMLVLEVPAHGMNWKRLTECQRDAAAGLYAEALAGFVQWLSPRYDDVQDHRRRRVAELRDQAMAEGGCHRRTPAIVAELAFGLELFVRFASEARVIDAATADDLQRRGWDALGATAGSQAEHLQASDPVLRFLELLRSSIASGNAHLASPDGLKPEEPAACGWRWKSIGAGVSERDEWQSQGQRVGWIESGDVYLEPDAAYRAAQQMATADGPAVTPRTLWKRMHERGVLASRDDARKRNTVRRKLEGARRDVLHLKKETLLPQRPSQPSQSSREPEKPRSGGTFPWDGSEAESRKPSHETGPQNPENRADGTIGPNGTVSGTEEEEIVRRGVLANGAGTAETWRDII